MATVEEHYERILSDVYIRMFGGFDKGVERNIDFFKKHKINPLRSGLAIDLGAGCGFQSIPLAKAGFSVIAFDLNGKLLNVLKENSRTIPIKAIQDDLINFNKHVDGKAELVVCMTDTLLHLKSKDKVLSLFKKVFASLDGGGRFIITLDRRLAASLLLSSQLSKS